MMDINVAQGLWRQWKASGSPADLNELIRANQGLVGKVAKKYLGQGLSYDELLSAGQDGLLRAANAYDPALGAWFTYAHEKIRGMILNALQKFRNQRDREGEKSDLIAATNTIDFKAMPVGDELEKSEIWRQVNHVATDKERQAITLVFKEGQSYRDAAGVMQTSRMGVARLIESGLRRIEKSGVLEAWRA